MREAQEAEQRRDERLARKIAEAFGKLEASTEDEP